MSCNQSSFDSNTHRGHISHIMTSRKLCRPLKTILICLYNNKNNNTVHFMLKHYQPVSWHLTCNADKLQSQHFLGLGRSSLSRLRSLRSRCHYDLDSGAALTTQKLGFYELVRADCWFIQTDILEIYFSNVIINNAMTPVRFTEIVYMLPKNVLSSCWVLMYFSLSKFFLVFLVRQQEKQNIINDVR